MQENRKYKIAFLISHPIPYFSPLLKKMSRDEEIDIMVYYCSDETLKTFKDTGFKREIKWDIPLLEGYRYKFLKNHSPVPSIFKGFFGLMNFGIIRELFKNKYDVIIIHGWNYLTHVLTIFIAKLRKIKVFLRGENPYNQEIKKKKFKIILKKSLLQGFLFKLIDGFLYIGNQNKKFYKFYNVPENKLYFVPYAVDNKRFKEEYKRLKDKKIELRKELKLPVDKIIILFVGKLIDKKRPFDLLKAFEKIKDKNKALLFVGDGRLRENLKKYVKEKNIKNVIFAGFKNQTELPLYYTCADIFVLPSTMGETWGLVVNEGMNFELPIVVSDMVGCAEDLVKDGENGFIFKTEDINQLAECLQKLIKNRDLRKKMGKRSGEIIREYSYEKDVQNLKICLKNIFR